MLLGLQIFWLVVPNLLLGRGFDSLPNDRPERCLFRRRIGVEPLSRPLWSRLFRFRSLGCRWSFKLGNLCDQWARCLDSLNWSGRSTSRSLRPTNLSCPARNHHPHRLLRLYRSRKIRSGCRRRSRCPLFHDRHRRTRFWRSERAPWDRLWYRNPCLWLDHFRRRRPPLFRRRRNHFHLRRHNDRYDRCRDWRERCRIHRRNDFHCRDCFGAHHCGDNLWNDHLFDGGRDRDNHRLQFRFRNQLINWLNQINRT